MCKDPVLLFNLVFLLKNPVLFLDNVFLFIRTQEGPMLLLPLHWLLVFFHLLWWLTLSMGDFNVHVFAHPCKLDNHKLTKKIIFPPKDFKIKEKTDGD